MKKFSFIVFFTLNSLISYSQNADSSSSGLDIDKKTNCQLRYHYYPNLQAYYDLLKNVFYYQENGNWYSNETLPKNYGGYSLYKMNYVLITDYDDDEPYQYLNIHKKLYPYNFKGTKK